MNVRITLSDLPVRHDRADDACDVLIEVQQTVESDWRLAASHDFWQTPGANVRRARQWIDEMLTEYLDTKDYLDE